jgi:hypothetical protein
LGVCMSEWEGCDGGEVKGLVEVVEVIVCRLVWFGLVWFGLALVGLVSVLGLRFGSCG